MIGQLVIYYLAIGACSLTTADVAEEGEGFTGYILNDYDYFLDACVVVSYGTLLEFLATNGKNALNYARTINFS